MKKIIYAMAALSVMACTSSRLDNKSFTIVELNGTEYVSMGDEAAFISFGEGKYRTYVGGNRIFGAYREGKDGSLSISDGGMTRMLVPDEYREDELVLALGAVSSFRLDGDVMVLLSSEGDELLKAVIQE